jgi:hypothetical protein
MLNAVRWCCDVWAWGDRFQRCLECRQHKHRRDLEINVRHLVALMHDHYIIPVMRHRTELGRDLNHNFGGPLHQRSDIARAKNPIAQCGMIQVYAHCYATASERLSSPSGRFASILNHNLAIMRQGTFIVTQSHQHE